MKEIERKFIAKHYPPDIINYTKDTIKQWYLSDPGDYLMIRLRRYGNSETHFEIKNGAGITREEIGWQVNFNEFKEIIKGRPYIQKTRYTKKMDNYTIFVDEIYTLLVVEVEAESEEIVNNIKIEDWFGKEVSDNVEYTNHHIAFNGLPKI